MNAEPPALTVPLEPVLDEYVRMHSELTLTVTQLKVLLAERTRELEEARAQLAAAQQAPSYGVPETLGHAQG